VVEAGAELVRSNKLRYIVVNMGKTMKIVITINAGAR
jgi:hypothetical protein